MFQAFTPILNEIYTVKNYALFWIKGGKGIFQVDFKNYHYLSNKVFFLAPGQYFKLIEGNFDIQQIEFSSNIIHQFPDARFLFKHVVALGHIEAEPIDQQVFIQNLKAENPAFSQTILQNSIDKWLQLNPFQTTSQETKLIFDLKNAIDTKHGFETSIPEIVSDISTDKSKLNALIRNKLGVSVKGLVQRKILLEARKEIAFSDKSIKEIAMDLGFSDPAYFNRFFKMHTQQKPLEFRECFGHEPRDSFVEDLLFLIDTHFKTEHSTIFYANTLCMSIQSLSKKVKEKTNKTVGELVREKLLKEAKDLLIQQFPVKEIAYELGFYEPQHFSNFFKTNTGQSPSRFAMLS